MNERKLKIFYEVALKLNMTNVAESMYISQPAVSQTINELEEELGTKLFDRIGRKLYLTYEGELFLSYVRRILNLYNEAIKNVKEANNLEGGKLKIGASTTIGIYVLPHIIGEFLKKYKNIDISIAVENTKIIADMIMENKIDFAFVEGPVNVNEINIKKFCNDELVFITPFKHPWHQKGKIKIDEVSNEKVIMREQGSGTREVFELLMKSHNVNYNIAFELGNTEAIKKSVEAGLGISCISKRCINKEVSEKRLGVVKVEECNINREFNLIYHKDKYISRLFQTFIDFAMHNNSL